MPSQTSVASVRNPAKREAEWVQTLYLIGPSNVGKTTSAEMLDAKGLVLHVDLDKVLKTSFPDQDLIGPAQDWGTVEPLLTHYDARVTDPLTLISIGAGTQDRDREWKDHNLQGWLEQRRNRVILIEGDRAELFLRSKVHTDVAVFEGLEYGPERQRIYQIADRTVSFAGVSEEAGAECLARAITAFMNEGID
jgi:hypothetical protein